MIGEEVLRASYIERLDVLAEVVRLQPFTIYVFRLTDATTGREIENVAHDRCGALYCYHRELSRIARDVRAEGREEA